MKVSLYLSLDKVEIIHEVVIMIVNLRPIYYELVDYAQYKSYCGSLRDLELIQFQLWTFGQTSNYRKLYFVDFLHYIPIYKRLLMAVLDEQ